MSAGTPKLLARALLGSSITDIGTVPSGKIWTVEFVHVSSLDTSTRTINLHHKVSGDSASDDTNAWLKATPLYAGNAWQMARGSILGALDKLTGLCSLASGALVSVYGIEHTDTRCKLLARGQLGTGIAIIGSAVPAAKSWKAGLIHLCSVDATVQRTFRLHHRSAVLDSDDLSNALFYDSPIPATDAIEFGKCVEMATGDSFKGLCSSASKVTVHAYGIEY
jgi:hypothetical protein